MSDHNYPPYWDADVEHVEGLLRVVAGDVPVKRWKCPCGEPQCDTYVTYAKADIAGECRVVLLATRTFTDPGSGGVFAPAIKSVADIDRIFLTENEGMNPYDQKMYAIWFSVGLKEVVLRELDVKAAN